MYVISQNASIAKTDNQKDYLNQILTALNISTECIDKQLPVSLWQDKYCMRCKTDLEKSNHFRYCPNCGQRLSWENEN